MQKSQSCDCPTPPNAQTHISSLFLFYFSQHSGDQAVISAEVSGWDGCSEERSISRGDETE